LVAALHKTIVLLNARLRDLLNETAQAA
jgi:hypothetical protein